MISWVDKIMKPLHALLFSFFALSNTFADDGILFLKSAAGKKNYVNYIISAASNNIDMNMGKAFTYDDYNKHITEKNEYWDALVLDESRRPHKNVERQKIYLRKLRNTHQMVRSYTIWDYLDDISSTGITYQLQDVPIGFTDDNQKAKQMLRIDISQKRNFDYHVSIRKAEEALNTVITALKPTLCRVYNKCITYISAILSMFGLDVDWRHFMSKHYLRYEDKIPDGFLDEQEERSKTISS